MGRYKTYALVFIAALLFAALAFVYSERVIIERFLSLNGGDPLTLPIEWYTPKEALPGAAIDSFPVATKADRTIPESVLADISSYAEEQGSQSLIVVHKGTLQLEQYWRGADRETRFNPQSMSKSVLALLTGIAIEDGKIGSVTDPISKYIGEWKNDPRGTATIEQILRMTAGLEQMAVDGYYDVDFLSRVARYSLGEDFNGMILDLRQVDEPGTKFEYNPEEANLLGIAIERATGKRYAEYLSEKLWQPLGLADASMYLDRPGGAAMKSCCVFSRPYDWAKIGLLISQNGAWDGEQLVPAGWIKAMITPSPLRDFYGYFVWLGSSYIQRGESSPPKSDIPVAPEDYHADDMIIFLGFGEQRIWISPSNELVIVRGTNQWAPSWNETYIPNVILDGLAAMDTASDEPPK